METKVAGESSKTFKILGWATIAAAVLFLVCIISLLAETSRTMGAGLFSFIDVLMLFYQYNALVLCALVCLMIALLVARHKRETYAKVFLWVTMVLTIFSVSLVIQNLYNALPQTVAESRFDLIAVQMPTVCAALSLIALAACWDVTEKKAVNRVAMVCAIIAAFMAIFYLSRFARIPTGAATAQVLQVLMNIASLVALVLISVDIWYLTTSRRMFDRVVYAMSDEDAALVEGVEDKIHAVVSQMEDEIMEDIATAEAALEETLVLDRETMDEIADEAEEKAETPLEEMEDAGTEIKEEISEVNEHLVGDEPEEK